MNQSNSLAVSMCRSAPYDPYGAQFGNHASLLAFNGELRDAPTGNYLLGNGRRAYSPTLRRFLSADQLSPFSKGGINAYAYCLGDPLNRHDPSGTSSLWVLAKRVVWFGSRIKAFFSGRDRLKTLGEGATWLAGIGGAMASYGVPGAKELAAVGSVVRFSVKVGSVGKALKKHVDHLIPASGPYVMDLAGAEFSPFVGPFAGNPQIDSQASKSVGPVGLQSGFSSSAMPPPPHARTSGEVCEAAIFFLTGG
ncbi:RHS repeat-associated core domain-containing protein [Pseudomonas putida]|uniref:RHS repeat-associated core domain-containing protein n=1 Tax=Pseudomonas putida TaxID=303 RepID=UPI003709E3C5